MKSFSILLAFTILSLLCQGMQKNKNLPNVIIINCDDLGYGDLGVYGNKLNRTPNIDKLAEEGTLFTNFYSASSLCTPSRAALLTGCYPVRINMEKNYRGECVIFPVDEKGLNSNEITIAELLKQKNYSTAIIGKWHLGDQPQFLPTEHGFDYYFGIPYSNDTGPGFSKKRKRAIYDCPPIPLVRNTQVIEAPVDQSNITQRYTQEALNYMERNSNNPFFLYLAHTMPHWPLHASEKFKGKSNNGLYGDVIEEIDWSTGQIIQKLKELNIDKHTFLIFTSDNGAARKVQESSNAPFSGHKATTMEGGLRVPCIMHYPDFIPAGVKNEKLITMMDIFPTIANITGIKVPQDRIIDGKDISNIITGITEESPHKFFCYYMMGQLQAVRVGYWKLHLELNDKLHHWNFSRSKRPMKLYNLANDFGETNDVSKENPEIVERLLEYARTARHAIGDEDYHPVGNRPSGFISNPKPLVKIK